MKSILIIAVLGLSALALAGCEKPLFPENLPRTQYERFDRLRGAYSPQETYDAYGRPVPALRERLSPYE